MNCKNGAAYLNQALDSIYAQTYSNWEIIFWDNESTDDSAAIARRRDTKLRYFFAPGKASLGASRDLALAQAKGEFISFLDCDDLWMPHKLEKQVALFTKDLGIGLVFSDTIVYYQAHGSWYKRYSITPAPPRGKIFDHLLKSYCVSMPTIMFRKSALDTLGQTFDETLYYAPDYDLVMRMALAWKCDYVDEPQAVYRCHSSICQIQFSWREADERSLITEKIMRLLPDLEQTHAEVLACLRKNITVIRAKSFWAAGDSAAARRELRRLPMGFRTMLIKLCTFLPHNLVMRIWFYLQSFRGGGKRVKDMRELVKIYG